jgi:hypothetical protein
MEQVRCIRVHLVGEAPEDVAWCGFDCERGQCFEEEWRRITRAAGELMPESSTAAERSKQV